MIINLILADDGPPFFFLGDPKRLILSLTYQDPGPMPIDFEDLSLVDQKKIIIAVSREQLESDVPYPALVTEYEKLFSKDAPVVPEPQAPPKEPAGAPPVVDPTEERNQQEASFQKECQTIVKQKIKAIKANLENESDLRKLRTIRDLELQKKSPRITVVNYINLELRKLQAGIVEEIENGDNVIEIDAEPALRKETFVSDVVESNLEIVHLTPEVLISRATK